MEKNVLALISDLYGQITVLQQQNAQLREALESAQTDNGQH